MKRVIQSYSFIFLICSSIVLNAPAVETKDDLSDFVSLFDGKSLQGWRKFAEYSGDRGSWQVINGAIVGDQYPEGQGGLLVTAREYSDFELFAEVKTDYPVDTGLFLRTQPDGNKHQVTIDYRPEAEIGAIWGSGRKGYLQHCYHGFTYWHPNEYNPIRVRIEGQPPRIQVWIRETLVTDYLETLKADDGGPLVPASGLIGIQIHAGDIWGKGNKVYFRKIMVKELK